MEDRYIDIHQSERRLERSMQRMMEDPRLPGSSKQVILQYARDARLGKTIQGRAKKKIGPARILSNISHLTTFVYAVQRDLAQVSMDDMEKFIEALEAGRIVSRQQVAGGPRKLVTARKTLSESYAVDLKLALRKFYRWMHGGGKVYPPLVDWFDTSRKTPEISALTAAEVERMIDKAQRIQHRALMQVMFDGGFRVSELLNIRLRHVVLRSYDDTDPTRRCFFLRVPYSKTVPRTVSLPMPESTKWLMHWLEEHPGKPVLAADGTVQAPDLMQQLFPMSMHSVNYVLHRFGTVALKKHVYPHLMRHTSATYWCNKLPYFKFCKRFGWAMTSKMPHRYIDREGIDEADVAKIYHDDTQRKLMLENERLRANLSSKAGEPPVEIPFRPTSHRKNSDASEMQPVGFRLCHEAGRGLRSRGKGFARIGNGSRLVPSEQSSGIVKYSHGE